MSEPIPATRSTVLCSSWATLADVPEVYRDRVDEATWSRYLMQASEIMWALSGRRWYGAGCEETATLRSYPPPPGEASWPYDASWGRCGCSIPGYPLVYGADLGIDHPAPIAVKLPRNPVTAVVEVTEDGVTLDLDTYRVNRAGWLERLDGRAWVTCGETTTVTYSFGQPPPEGGVQAVVTFAVQLMLDGVNDPKCRLPARLTNLTRQGVSVSVMDPMDFLADGRTGFYGVDLWLATVNPLKRPARGVAWSLDVPTAVKGTTDVPS